MKLYTKPGACSLGDHIALRWIGKPFDLQVMDAAALKSPEYLKLRHVVYEAVRSRGGGER